MSSASMIILNNVKDAYYTGGMKKNDTGTWSTFVHNGRLMDGFRLSEWRVV